MCLMPAQPALIAERIFRDRGLRVFVHDIPPYDLEGALSVCRGVLETYGADGAVTLNVTGGTKVAALAAYQQFFFDSRRIIYDDEEYEYETGTQNGPGIAGLAAAALWVAETGTERIALKEQRLAERLTEGLASIRGIHIYGQGLAVRGPVVSFDSDKLPPADLAYILQNSYDIVTRAGLHCAPLIHEYTGSGEKGTLRVSFSWFNTDEDVDELLCALKEILLQDMEDRHEDN